MDDAPGGLQVCNRRGEWVDVMPVADSFVVNVGDLMMLWTNDRWISTLHRVVNPPPDRALGSARLSLVFFHMPNYDTVIRCIESCRGPDRPPKYPPVTTGEHLMMKFRKSFPAKAGAAPATGVPRGGPAYGATAVGE
jgi:isopenicillin N synthase-like dioxygenase